MDVLYIVLRFVCNAFLVVMLVIASTHVSKFLHDRRMRKKRLDMYDRLERELNERVKS